MNKIKNVLTALLILVVSLANAQWISLKTEKNAKKEPIVTILSDSDNSTTIDIKLSGFDMNYEIVDGVDYQVLNLYTDSKTNIVGAPSLPIIPSLIAVPDNASVSVEIIETGEVTTYENINLLPGRKSWIDGEKETAYNKNLEIYNTNKMFPNNSVKIDKPAIFRDFRIVRLAISPMQYNPVTKQLKVISSFKIKLNYIDDGKAINPRTISKKSITPSFDKLYKSSILNYESLKTRLDTHLANDLMLCIVPDALYNDFLPYADWKKRTGIDIHITKFSDIGANENNPITIKDHITDAYHNWDTPPSYVLLVGDKGVFPVKTYNATDGWSFAWENYFVEIDGGDFLPEMLIGRFTNQGNYRMRVMMNKFEKYIREPYVEDGTDWFVKGLFSSNSAFQSQVNTIAWTRDLVLNNTDFISVDPMMWNGTFDANGVWDWNCNYNVTDVLNGLNEGRSVVNYRGEGWITGWHDNCIEFQSEDLVNLNPSRKNFFFTNIGCGVAMFDISEECFGEKLVEQGTISNPKGAIAFIGPTSNTHTTYNNKMDKGIYKGMYQEGLDTPGEGLERGRIYQYAVFGPDDYYVEYHHKVFCVLGDPSIKIWKEIPLAVNVTHVSSLPTGNNNITIAVAYQDSGLFAEGATVTLTNDNNLFITGTTDSNGNITFNNVEIDNLGVVNVTVTGGDVITYEGEINMTVAGINDVSTDLANFYSQPNPFSIETKINYTLVEENNTSIKIYDVKGQLVRNLESNIQSAGNHSINWNGTDNRGNRLDTGMYFCKIISGKNVRTIKLLMK